MTYLLTFTSSEYEVVEEVEVDGIAELHQYIRTRAKSISQGEVGVHIEGLK